MDADVIVIGAGAAGIAAALQLAETSLRVIAVDARDRIGGRVTSQAAGSLEVPAELGAEFIHGDAPETSAFMRDAGIAKVRTGDAAWTCDSSSVLKPADDDFGSNDLFERALSLSADESVETFLKRFAGDARLEAQARRARAFVEGFEAADPALASVRSIADEIHSGVDSTSFRPVEGYAPLFAHLATRCARAGVDLRLNTGVERIAWQRGAVTVEANGGDLQLRATCAVITLPVGVLRQAPGAAPLAFEPPLPAEKQTALRGLEMGHAVRVTLAFKTPFWERLDGGRFRDAAFFRRETGTYNAFWTQFPSRSRAIVGWAGGTRAQALNGRSAGERLARACDEFGELFGRRELARGEYDGGVTHDWTADPFARGAYSYVVTGGGNARAALGSALDDALFFAGEATAADGQGGTVSGAFASGMRAARDVARTLERAGSPAQTTP